MALPLNLYPFLIAVKPVSFFLCILCTARLVLFNTGLPVCLGKTLRYEAKYAETASVPAANTSFAAYIPEGMRR